ncbi:hypothetical protein HDV05_000966 [Chytridiales sp. JEL 0842]|nr:hypothetical protein HDV05_000966 [Chytridiales sp. JEL 0842]
MSNPTLDKLAQYTSKIIIWHLKKRNPSSDLAIRISNFATPVSDFRILLRYYGLIPLTQWILFSEANPPPTAFLRLLYRLQNLVNLAYYPLEHTYWLGAHKIIPISDEKLGKIGIWSCRFWAAYVVLYFFQLHQEAKILSKRSADLVARAKKGEDKEVLKVEHNAIASELNSLMINTVINAAYFPLTIHWSIENSKLPDVAVGVFGTIAAVFQLAAAWASA